MLPQKGRIWAEDMVSFFPIIVESTKLNAEFTSIEYVHFRDVVPWRAVCLPHAKAIEAAAFFFGFPLSAIICNSRSLAVLPYCLRFDVISVLQSFSLDLQNNCLDVLFLSSVCSPISDSNLLVEAEFCKKKDYDIMLHSLDCQNIKLPLV